MYRYPICIFLLSIFHINVQAQYLSPLSLPFVVDGTDIKNPLTGGLNTPQVSAADFNNDGWNDLFVFDRSGNVPLVYLNDGLPGQASYSFAPTYMENLPNLNDWVLLRDFNQDGAADLFTAARTPGISGMEVMRGYYENDELKFSPVYFDELSFNIIPFPIANGSYTNLYVSAQDIPAIDDIDGDGDLDIIAFGVNGGYMEYFVNQSVEDGFGLDSLIFERATDCFGGVFESGLSTCVCLPETPGACCDGLGGLQADTRHAGSTIVAFDNDADGDKELVLGDISFNALTLLVNGGDTEMAVMTDQDCNFPAYDVAVDLPSFPAGFYEDVNNDGKRDLLAAPNAPRLVEDYFCLWYYRNDGADNAPDFNFRQRDFLVEETLDMGSGSSPVLVDFNQDGLMDVVVGTNSFYRPFSAKDPRLFAYRNVGTVNSPAFELFDDDWLNFSQYASNAWAFAPTFGDLDNDGDLDMMVGYQEGGLFYGENTAGDGNPFQFNITPDYLDIDVGQNSTPTLVDLNRDGKLDLVIGERNGNLNFLPNIGTTEDPAFAPDHSQFPNNPFLGQVETAPFGFDIGMSAPVFVDFNGSYTLFAGSYTGQVFQYDDIDGHLDGAFNLVTDRYGDNIRIGDETRPAIADLDGDDVLEMLIGNFRGGLNAFQMNLATDGTVGTANDYLLSEVAVFPNPATADLYFSLNAGINEYIVLRIYNALGQLVHHQKIPDQEWTLSVQDWTPGVYFCEMRNGNKTWIEKIIVQSTP